MNICWWACGLCYFYRSY